MEEQIISSVRFLGALPMFVAAACLLFFNRGKLQSATSDSLSSCVSISEACALSVGLI